MSSKLLKVKPICKGYPSTARTNKYKKNRDQKLLGFCLSFQTAICSRLVWRLCSHFDYYELVWNEFKVVKVEHICLAQLLENQEVFQVKVFQSEVKVFHHWQGSFLGSIYFRFTSCYSIQATAFPTRLSSQSSEKVTSDTTAIKCT